MSTATAAERVTGIIGRITAKLSARKAEQEATEFEEGVKPYADLLSLAERIRQGESPDADEVHDVCLAVDVDPIELVADSDRLTQRIEARRVYAIANHTRVPSHADLFALVATRKRRKLEQVEEMESLNREIEAAESAQKHRNGEFQNFAAEMRTAVPGAVARLRAKVEAAEAALRETTSSTADTADKLFEAKKVEHDAVMRGRAILDRVEVLLAELDSRTPITDTEGN